MRSLCGPLSIPTGKSPWTGGFIFLTSAFSGLPILAPILVGALSMTLTPVVNQIPGHSRDNPSCGNCSAAEPTKNNTNTVVPNTNDGLYIWVWLDEGMPLQLQLKNSTSNNPVQNSATYSITYLNGTLLTEGPYTNANPKVFVFVPPVANYYIIQVYRVPILPVPLSPILEDIYFQIL